MLFYDPKKRGEYKFRIYLSIAASAFVAFASLRTGASSPAFWELILFGFGFCILSIMHSLWALINISKQQKSKNLTD